MNNIINLTPHGVNILDQSCVEYNSENRSYTLIGSAVTLANIAPSGQVARCSTNESDCGSIPFGNNNIPLLAIEFGDIINLPEPQEDTYYVVSSIVASAGREQGRKDLLVPAHLVRDEQGNIVGCLALSR